MIRIRLLIKPDPESSFHKLVQVRFQAGFTDITKYVFFREAVIGLPPQSSTLYIYIYSIYLWAYNIRLSTEDPD